MSLADGPFRPVDEKEKRRWEKERLVYLVCNKPISTVDALVERGKNLNDRHIYVRYSRMLA